MTEIQNSKQKQAASGGQGALKLKKNRALLKSRIKV